MVRRLFGVLLGLWFGLSGIAQNALNFDGVDDYVQTDYAGISGTAARTVEAWIRTTANANPSDGGVQQIITDWGTFVTGGRFTFNVLWSNAIRIEVGGSGLSGTIPVNDGVWHHVAVVYDPLAADPYSLYVDGVLDVAGDIVTDINTVLGVDMRIGQRVDIARHFEGEIDEVRVWNYARSLDDLVSNMSYEFCSVPDGLVAYYKFNHGIAGGVNTGITVLEDFAGGGHDGDLMNFTLSGSESNWVEGADLAAEITADLTASACLGYTVPSGDETYTVSGVYMDTLTSVLGCDSIITIDLSIGFAEATWDVTACDSYTVPSGDETYDISGIYMDTIPAIGGCDSILTLHVLVNYSSVATIEEFACESYTVPSGETTYFASGIYTDIIENEAGCDSVIVINLTIGEPSFATIVEETCYSYTVPSGDETYTESGVYTDVIPNAEGCDSIITIILTIHGDSESLIAETACDSYISPSGDFIYVESGVYTDVIENEAGCDSVITIDLTIVEVNTGVTVLDPVLTANAVGATYQWVNCDDDYAAIDGATNQEFTPTANGNYAVIVAQDGCSDTSDCYAISTVGLADNAFPNAFYYYPNPTQKDLWIQLGDLPLAARVMVYAPTGQVVSDRFFTGEQLINLELQGEDGLYFIRVISETQERVFTVVKREEH